MIKNATIWGLLVGLSVFIFLVFEKLAGFLDEHISYHDKISLIMIPIFVLIYFLAIKSYRNYKQEMTFAEGFKYGSLVALFAALFAVIFVFIFLKFIAPGYFQHAISYGVSMGHDIEKLQEYFTLNSYMIQTGLSQLALGVVTSCLFALLLKKK